LFTIFYIEQGDGEEMKNCIWNFLRWSFFIFIGLLILGVIVRDITQTSDFMKWLVFRRWFPYPQAALLSILVMAFALILSDLLSAIENVNNVPWYLRILVNVGKILAQICPRRKNNLVGGVLFLAFLALFIISILLPKCLVLNQIRVTFDIRDKHGIINALPGEIISAEPGSYINIETRLETRLPNLSLSQITCTWVHMGDGSIVPATQCATDYRIGVDNILDTVSVQLSQSFCPSLGVHTIILKRSDQTGE
jgi:hypothetical protein